MNKMTRRSRRQAPKFTQKFPCIFYLLVGTLLASMSVGCNHPLCVDGRPIEEDLDGDALPDCFEDGQGDIDGDGKADPVVTLPLSSGQKDIIVRYDWMACDGTNQATCEDNHDHEPDAEALEDVRLAFLRSPVTNPDGSTGIRIHYERGGPIAHQQFCDCVCIEDIVRGQQRLLTPEQRADENAEIIATVKEKLVHYVLFSHQHENSGSSGIACRNGFTHVSLGTWSHYGTRTAQAGTLMHELGHQLGLRHGGSDDINRKPNYLSVMNYSFQTDNDAFGLDYSHEKLLTLDKDALDESVGIGIPAWSTSTAITRFFLPDLTMASASVVGSIDWDHMDGSSIVSQDINGNTICVTPGPDGILQTDADPSDIYFRYRADAFMLISSEFDISPEDVSSVYEDDPNLVRVEPGIDNVLDTPRPKSAVMHGFMIVAGDDNECNTQRLDIQEDDFLQFKGKIEAKLYGHDDWSNLVLTKLFDLKGGFGEEIPEILPEIEWHEPFTPLTVQRRYESDIQVRSTGHFEARTREVVYEVEITNLGPQEATERALTYVRLPATAAEADCTASAGRCAIAIGHTHAILYPPPLAVGQQEVYRISLQVDASACDTPEAYTANVWTATTNVELDHSNDRYDLPFPDADGDGQPDVCVWPINQLGVYGMETVRLANRVQVKTTEGWGVVAANGTVPLHLDTDSQVGFIFSVPSVFMANRSIVRGNLTTGDHLDRQYGANVLGDILEGTPPSPVLPDLYISMNWPSKSSRDVEVLRDGAHELAPGAYDHVVVYGGADLYLSPGDYIINHLQLEAQARVHVDDVTGGAVRIFVRDQLTVRAEWIVRNQAEERILLAYDGDAETTFDTSFYGTILAPHSAIRFGSAAGLILRGALLAQEVELRPDVVVTHIPFTGQWSWDSASHVEDP